MLFIQQFFQNVFLRVRMFFGPLTSVYYRLRVYLNPRTAIKNQFAGVTERWQILRFRLASIRNSILPESWQRKLGFSKPQRRGKGGDGDEDFGELSASKSRRLSGGRKLKPLQKQAQFSQIHLINEQTQQRKIAHIGQKVDRSWTEMFVEVDEDHSVRLSYTIVDAAVYGSNVAITYERGDAEVVVDSKPLTHDISLPIYNESIIVVADVSYVVDMFAYEALPIQTRVDAAWVTNVGPVRDDNQDAIGLYQHDKAYMFTIADGVGGGYAGDIVSEYAVKYLLKTFQKNIKHDLSWIKILRKAFQHTNAEVRKFVERSPYPAGTTLTTLVIREWTAYIAHVGDSRVYHLRGTQFTQLTEDHRESHPVERTTKYEHIPDEFLPLRDVLVRAIGKRDAIDPQIITMALQPGDKLLMITDGVTHQVGDDEMYRILITDSIDDAPDKLVTLANERENTDNASVILIDVMEQAFEKDIWSAVSSDRVYIGGKNWKLDLSRPAEMHTDYVVPNQVGCMTIIMALLTCAVLWWGIPQLAGNLTPETTGIVNSTEITSDVQATPTLESTSVTIVEPTRVTEISATPIPVIVTDEATPVSATDVIIDATAEIQPSATATDIPATSTASTSPTPFITRTPFPTIAPILGPTSTQIPPTSTLRA